MMHALIHKNIEHRLQTMIKKGFLEEVRTLIQHPKINISLKAINSIGYLQAYEYILGTYNYDTFFHKSLSATRNLAKRQITWIKNWKKNIYIISKDYKKRILEKFT